MTTVSNLQNAPVANATWIDALLDSSPAWNYLVPFRTTIYYTFSVTSGTETGVSRPGLQAFNETQKTAAREILAHAANVTGITFVETSEREGNFADIHFASYDILGRRTIGNAWTYGSYTTPDSGELVSSYTPSVYVYLDNREFLVENVSPHAGNQGYEVLLHEIGHALGLKHPFEDGVILSTSLDNSSHTVMSYTHLPGTPYYSTFQEIDLAALAYLYGGDGLGGDWGVGAAGRYYQGTASNDTFTAGAGRHTWVGLDGADAVNYPAAIGGVMFSRTADSEWLKITGSGLDDWVAASIEQLGFSSGTTLPVSLLIAALGTSGQRLFAGTSAGDGVAGTGGNDLFYVGDAGNDVFDGGGGIDTALLGLNRAQAQIQHAGAGYQLTSTYGSDTLNSIERLRFSDKNIAFDLDGAAGNTAKLMGAIFGRTYVTASDNPANAAIVGAGLDLFDSGRTMEQVAELALASGLLPGGRTHTNVVNQLFNNVAGRLPSSAEQSPYVTWLDTGAYTQASLAVFAAETELNTTNINLVGLAGTGIEYA